MPIIFPRTQIDKPPMGSQINWGHPLAQNLVGCWLMNEGGGLFVRDSARRNDGVISGALWQSSLKGKVLYFDGTDDYIDNSTLTSITGDFTLVCWADDDGSASFNTLLSSKSIGNSGWTFRSEQFNNTGKVGITWWGVGDYVTNIATPSGWAFYAAVHNNSNNTVDIYVNNSSQRLVVGNILTHSNGLVIGAGHRAGGYVVASFMNGKIAHTYIYNRALSPSEIQQLYSEPYCFIQPKRRLWL